MTKELMDIIYLILAYAILLPLAMPACVKEG